MSGWEPDFTFGDVIEEEMTPGVLIMVIAQNHGEAFEANDHYTIGPDRWVGLVLASNSPTAFPPGETTWIPPWNWEVQQ